MLYFLDTEFIENGQTIDLISIGIVAEDGREFYAVSKAFNRVTAFGNEWLVENVLPHLPIKDFSGNTLTLASFSEDYSHPAWMSLTEIRDGILAFIGEDPAPEFWSYFADYDWVVFCWIFGRMVDLPRGFPMYCNDLRQLMNHYPNVTKPDSSVDEHHALADARWNKQFYELLSAGSPVTFKPAFRPGDQVFTLSNDQTSLTINAVSVIAAVGVWNGTDVAIHYEVTNLRDGVVVYGNGQTFLPESLCFNSEAAAREGLVERVRQTAKVVGVGRTEPVA